MNNMKYFFIWLLPFATLCVCGYNFIHAAWIFITVSDNIQRLDGFAYLIIGIIHLVIFIVFAVVALALTVFTYRKTIEDKRNESYGG